MKREAVAPRGAVSHFAAVFSAEVALDHQPNKWIGIIPEIIVAVVKRPTMKKIGAAAMRCRIGNCGRPRPNLQPFGLAPRRRAMAASWPGSQ
jgi:hypothetical protein